MRDPAGPVSAAERLGRELFTDYRLDATGELLVLLPFRER
jgi:hypothetical protein